MSKAQFLPENQRPGEVYSGLILGENGEDDYHLFVMPFEYGHVTRRQAKEFALRDGGDLPTRREQHVLFANAKAAFKAEVYWSSELHAQDSNYAWCQNFNNGYQFPTQNGNCLHARPIRRLPIKE